jgi:antitoxin YefM
MGKKSVTQVVRFFVQLADGGVMSVTASEARQRLFPLIEEVNDDQVAVEIVSKKGTAFLVSADEYRSLKETVYLLQSPKNAQRLRESLDAVRTGSAEHHELIE